MTRITATPWFGPKKHLGWGWRILNWQGAAVSAAFIALLAGALTLFHGTILGFAAASVIMFGFFVAVLLTGDPPGRANPRE